MAGFTDQSLELADPTGIPLRIFAKYDVDVDEGPGGLFYTIDLGTVEVHLAGSLIAELEGDDIPVDVRNRILAAITVSDMEMAEAWGLEEDDRATKAAHGAGL